MSDEEVFGSFAVTVLAPSVFGREGTSTELGGALEEVRPGLGVRLEGSDMKRRVLFLCTGNSARSQMAEAFVRHYAGDALEPHSAGLDPRGVNPLAVRVMQEVAIDIADQESKPVTRYMSKMHFTWVVSVCARAEGQCPRLFPNVRDIQYWPFEDPAAVAGNDEEKLAKFREVRDQIDVRVKTWLKDLAEADGIDARRA